MAGLPTGRGWLSVDVSATRDLGLRATGEVGYKPKDWLALYASGFYATRPTGRDYGAMVGIRGTF